MPEPLVQPLPGAAPEMAPPQAAPPEAMMAPPAAEAAPDEAPAPPPDLMEIPAFHALFAGAPPAFSFDLKGQSDREERQTVEKHLDYLGQAGFATYTSMNGKEGVLYNALHIHPEDLAAADKAGKLKQLAPDFDAVNHAVGKSGLSNPLLHAGEPPKEFAKSRSASISPQSASADALAQRISGATGVSAPPAPIVAPASSSAQRRVVAERVASLKPPAPTAGPAPGQGALLNSIMRPVV